MSERKIYIINTYVPRKRTRKPCEMNTKEDNRMRVLIGVVGNCQETHRAHSAHLPQPYHSQRREHNLIYSYNSKSMLNTVMVGIYIYI